MQMPPLGRKEKLREDKEEEEVEGEEQTNLPLQQLLADHHDDLPGRVGRLDDAIGEKFACRHRQVSVVEGNSVGSGCVWFGNINHVGG